MDRARILALVREAKVIAFDLDFTLTHFTGAGMDGLVDIFASRAAPRDLVKTALHEVNKAGFTFAEYQRRVEEKTGASFGATAASSFNVWLRKSLEAYDDTVGALTSARTNDSVIAIITFGDPTYQRQKLDYVGIKDVEFYPVPSHGAKWAIAGKLREKYGSPVVLIEDKPDELDAVRAHGYEESEILTVLVRRPDSPYAKRQPKHEHFTVTSLTELFEEETYG